DVGVVTREVQGPGGRLVGRLLRPDPGRGGVPDGAEDVAAVLLVGPAERPPDDRGVERDRAVDVRNAEVGPAGRTRGPWFGADAHVPAANSSCWPVTRAGPARAGWAERRVLEGLWTTRAACRTSAVVCPP